MCQVLFWQMAEPDWTGPVWHQAVCTEPSRYLLLLWNNQHSFSAYVRWWVRELQESGHSLFLFLILWPLLNNFAKTWANIYWFIVHSTDGRHSAKHTVGLALWGPTMTPWKGHSYFPLFQMGKCISCPLLYNILLWTKWLAMQTLIFF